MNYQFKGSHVLAEFYGVTKMRKRTSTLRKYLDEACEKADVTLLSFIMQRFKNGGYTAFALLAESHISIHTYPEYNSIFIDVFTCGDANTKIIIDRLSKLYMPERKHIQIIERGHENLINNIPERGENNSTEKK